jgi:hypothetical protein
MVLPERSNLKQWPAQTCETCAHLEAACPSSTNVGFVTGFGEDDFASFFDFAKATEAANKAPVAAILIVSLRSIGVS